MASRHGAGTGDRTKPAQAAGQIPPRKKRQRRWADNGDRPTDEPDARSRDHAHTDRTREHAKDGAARDHEHTKDGAARDHGRTEPGRRTHGAGATSTRTRHANAHERATRNEHFTRCTQHGQNYTRMMFRKPACTPAAP